MNTNTTVSSDKEFFFQNTTNNKIKKRDIHYHNNYEIYYLTSGKCWYFIDEKSYHLTNGDIALIPKGVIHKTSYETPYHSRMLINCSDYYLPKSVIELIPQIPYFTIPTASRTLINEIFDTIQNDYHSQNRFSEDIIKTKVYELFLFIARENSLHENEKNESPIVEKAVKYIHKHYADNLSLSDAAKYCFVSDEHLSRKFKKETGFGFNEYLNIYRLKKQIYGFAMTPKQKFPKLQQTAVLMTAIIFLKYIKKCIKSHLKTLKKKPICKEASHKPHKTKSKQFCVSVF